VPSPSVRTIVTTNVPDEKRDTAKEFSTSKEDKLLHSNIKNNVVEVSSEMINDPPHVARKLTLTSEGDVTVVDRLNDFSEVESHCAKVLVTIGDADHAFEAFPPGGQSGHLIECETNEKMMYDKDKTPCRSGSSRKNVTKESTISGSGFVDNIDRIRSTNLLDSEETIVDPECLDSFVSTDSSGIEMESVPHMDHAVSQSVESNDIYRTETADEVPDVVSGTNTPSGLRKTFEKKNGSNKVRSLFAFVSRRSRNERNEKNRSPAMTETVQQRQPKDSTRLSQGIDLQTTFSVPTRTFEEYIPAIIHVESQDQPSNSTPSRTPNFDPPKSIMKTPGRPSRKVAFSRTPLILQRLESLPARPSTLHDNSLAKNAGFLQDQQGLSFETRSWVDDDDDDDNNFGLSDYSGADLKPQDILVTSHPIPLVDDISFDPLDMYGASNKEFDDFA
jgi:hypothetical protein